MPNDEIEYNTNGDETPEHETGNVYSKKLSGYFYNKINTISNNDEFTAEEITEYGLEEVNGRINISTTKRLIKYLKSFIKVYTKTVFGDKVDSNEYGSFAEQTDTRLTSVESRLNSMINTIYPIGSIYMSFESTNPYDLFGVGTWVKLENRFLLGVSAKYGVGSLGGEETHKLTENELASHTHTQNSHTHTQNSHSHGTGSSTYNRILRSNGEISVHQTKRSFPSTGNAGYLVYSPNKGVLIDNTGISLGGTVAVNNSATAENQKTGGNGEHNNMPPYIAVYMWRRVS